MQMLNENGDSKCTFKAQYSNDFALDKFQLNTIELDSGVSFSVDYKDGYVSTEFEHTFGVFLTYDQRQDHWADPQLSTDTWYYPGITQWVNREGYEHFIIRVRLITCDVTDDLIDRLCIKEDMPADDLPINGLTVLSSSVGKHFFCM